MENSLLKFIIAFFQCLGLNHELNYDIINLLKTQKCKYGVYCSHISQQKQDFLQFSSPSTFWKRTFQKHEQVVLAQREKGLIYQKPETRIVFPSLRYIFSYRINNLHCNNAHLWGTGKTGLRFLIGMNQWWWLSYIASHQLRTLKTEG